MWTLNRPSIKFLHTNIKDMYEERSRVQAGINCDRHSVATTHYYDLAGRSVIGGWTACYGYNCP